MSDAMTENRKDTFRGLGRLSSTRRIALAPFTARLCEEVAERVWWVRVLEAHELEKQNGLEVDEEQHQRAIEECDSRKIRMDRAQRCWKECYKAVRGASERQAVRVAGRLLQVAAYAADRSMAKQAEMGEQS